MDTHRFRRIQRTHEHGSFGALKYAFTQIENLEDFAPIVIYIGAHQYEFLVNDGNETALYKKCVMRVGKFKKK